MSSIDAPIPEQTPDGAEEWHAPTPFDKPADKFVKALLESRDGANTEVLRSAVVDALREYTLLIASSLEAQREEGYLQPQKPLPLQTKLGAISTSLGVVGATLVDLSRR